MTVELARDVAAIAALFKAGGWAEIRVEAEGFSLLLSTDPNVAPSTGKVQIAAAQPAPFAPAVALPAMPSAIDAAWQAVVAPNLGTFYRSPKPGAAPFVEIGARVGTDTELCLLEVMKLFTSVKAGVAGTVRHIAVADAELVEGGQPLFYVDPD